MRERRRSLARQPAGRRGLRCLPPPSPPPLGAALAGWARPWARSGRRCGSRRRPPLNRPGCPQLSTDARRLRSPPPLSPSPHTQEGEQGDQSGFVEQILLSFQVEVQDELKVGARALGATQASAASARSQAPSQPPPSLTLPSPQLILVPRAMEIGQGLTRIGDLAQTSALASSEEPAGGCARLASTLAACASLRRRPRSPFISRLPAPQPPPAADGEYSQAQAELQRLSNLIQVCAASGRLAVGGGWAVQPCSCSRGPACRIRCCADNLPPAISGCAPLPRPQSFTEAVHATLHS